MSAASAVEVDAHRVSTPARAVDRHAVQRLAHPGDGVEEAVVLAERRRRSCAVPMLDRRRRRRRSGPGRGDITTTRSERNTASGIEWVTNTTAAPVSRADPDQLVLHPLAGHLVERAERLVHQQQPRALGQRPGDGDPLLHAAGELVGVGSGEVAQADQLEQLGDPGAGGSSALDAVQLERQLDVGRPRCATGAARPAGRRCRSPGRAAPGGPACRTPRASPEVGASRSAISRSSVLLPQPLGPISETNSPGATVEVDVAQRDDVAATAGEDPSTPATCTDGDPAALSTRARRCPGVSASCWHLRSR